MFNDTHLPPSEVNGAQAGSAAEERLDASALAPRFSRLALCLTAAGALTLGVVGTVAYGVWFEHDQQAYADAMASARQSMGMPEGANSLPVKQVVSAQAEVPSIIASSPATEATHDLSGSSGQNQQSLQSPQSQEAEEGSQQAVWSGQVARAQSAAIAPAGLDDTSLVSPAASTASASTTSSPSSTHRATGSTDPGAAQSPSSRTVKASRVGQDRRAPSANAQQNARLNAKQNVRHQNTLFARMGLFFRRVSYRQHGGANPQQQDIYSHP